MVRRTRNIHNKREMTYNDVTGKNLVNDLLFDNIDLSPFRLMNDHIQGRLDLDEVRSDPDFHLIEALADRIVTDYNKKRKQNKTDEKFIKDNFSDDTEGSHVLYEINNIKAEIGANNLNDIAEDWVREWQEKTGDDAGKDEKFREIEDFIKGSLKDTGIKTRSVITPPRKSVFRKSLVRYISIPAAAVVLALITIKVLVPSYNPDKLFNIYYEPFNIVLPDTRNSDSRQDDSYTSGIRNYKLGNYQDAAFDFSNRLGTDSSTPGPIFFMGITQLALGNFNHAISLLSKITYHAGEYTKDAEWYLGLAYLKTGEKAKAIECFDLLAKDSGYYRERADKILRLLK